MERAQGAVIGERERNAGDLAAAARTQRLTSWLSHDALRRRPFAIRFWDGSELHATEPESIGMLMVRSPRALGYLLREPNELGLGRAWASGTLDFDGDLPALLSQRSRFRQDSLSRADHLRAIGACLAIGGRTVLRRPPALAVEAVGRGRRHSLSRDRSSVRHHYELPSSFYELFLGPSLAYSCAYFNSPQDTLEQAQEHKLDLICRKLGLKPGQRLLDIGCGWGSLVLHAAAHYGVQALGVTLSVTQAETAKERIREAGLEDRCEVRVADYRELRQERFDAIASVGMYEHVGRDQLRTYAMTVERLLETGGAFLNHGIAQLLRTPRDERSFIARFVFPDGELHPITELLLALDAAGLELRDIESLREHYALTLRRWAANLAQKREQAVGQVGVERERIWRLYMAGSASAFELGEISLFQTLAVRRGERHRLPLNRLNLLHADQEM